MNLFKYKRYNHRQSANGCKVKSAKVEDVINAVVHGKIAAPVVTNLLNIEGIMLKGPPKVGSPTCLETTICTAAIIAP